MARFSTIFSPFLQSMFQNQVYICGKHSGGSNCQDATQEQESEAALKQANVQWNWAVKDKNRRYFPDPQYSSFDACVPTVALNSCS